MAGKIDFGANESGANESGANESGAIDFGAIDFGAIDFGAIDFGVNARSACRPVRLRGLRTGARAAFSLLLSLALLAPAVSRAAPSHPPACQKLVLNGEVGEGHEWKAAFGQGWVFRVLPIPPGEAGYSGWDLVVDREQPAGYPDALLVATPPYNSINEREVGTTYGLRAQDAIGWNPRSFRFLTAPAAFREGQKLYLDLTRNGLARPAGPTPAGPAQAGQSPAGSRAMQDLLQKLMDLGSTSSPGEFRILDARLTPGVADPAPYAQNWAFASEKTPHSVESSMGNPPTPLGELYWIKFSVTLWLPADWKAPRELHPIRTACSE